MDENYALVVFNFLKECGDILINWSNCLFGTKVNNTLDACWYLLLTELQCTTTAPTDSNFGTSSASLPCSISFWYFLVISMFRATIIWFYWFKFVWEDYLL